MDGLFRRGGMLWARLVVPARLRDLAGRREFVQSTGTHEHSIAKLVAATLLAGWRRQLYQWDRGRLENEKLLQLVEASHVLCQTVYITIKDASAVSGIDRSTLLKVAAAGRLELFYQLGTGVPGHVLPKHLLELVDPMQGMEGGVVVPNPGNMPEQAQEASFPGQTLRVTDGQDVAGAVLADALESVSLVLLDAPSPQGWVFAPVKSLQVPVDELALLTDKIETLRASIAARVLPERLEHARAERSALLQAQVLKEQAGLLSQKTEPTVNTSKWAFKTFSEAVEAYAADKDGMPGAIASHHEISHRKGQMLVFREFMGDLKLSEIDGDVLRAYRDGPLKTIPGSVNKLPKSIRHDMMKETIEALHADGRDWPLLSDGMRAERMRHIAGLFDWLERKNYLTPNPAVSLRGETGMTKAEVKDRMRRVGAAVRQSSDEDDEDGRRPFTESELQAIFSDQQYQTGSGRHKRWKDGHWYPFQYWLPLLGLYAGVRIKEGSQLHLSDVRLVKEIWCLDINENTEDKSLKNKSSNRVIPVPQQLIGLGFLDYLDALRAKGYRRVFPELTWSTSPAKYAKESDRRMTNMLRKLGLPRDGTLVYHCLRHNCNNALLRAPADSLRGGEYLRSIIALRVLGHAAGDGVNIKHYTSIDVDEMNRLMAVVEIDLPTIARFDIDFGLMCVDVALQRKEPPRLGCEDMGPLGVFVPGASQGYLAL